MIATPSFPTSKVTPLSIIAPKERQRPRVLLFCWRKRRSSDWLIVSLLGRWSLLLFMYGLEQLLLVLTDCVIWNEMFLNNWLWLSGALLLALGGVFHGVVVFVPMGLDFYYHHVLVSQSDFLPHVAVINLA